MKRNRKLYRFYVFAGVVLFALVLMLAQLLTRDRTFSSMENRNLQQRPALSWSSFTSGEYTKQRESHMEDQFPGRDVWMKLTAVSNRLLGKKESNGVFLGSDGYLIRSFTEADPSALQTTADSVAAFSARHSELKQYAVIAPTAATVLAGKLPAFADAGDEVGFIGRAEEAFSNAGVSVINVTEELKTAAMTQQVYYRTDHHWTTAGAYAAYQKFAAAAQTGGDAIVYTPRQVTDSFRGTLTASSGFRTGETDPIYIWEPASGARACSVEYVEEGVTLSTPYMPEQLEQRDQYTVFFGGNHGCVKIHTDVENDRVLLVFKDSYANCFVPFLCEDYSEIVMVDPRYYADDLEALVASEGVTEVLYLYCADGLASDTSLHLTLDVTE